MTIEQERSELTAYPHLDQTLSRAVPKDILLRNMESVDAVLSVVADNSLGVVNDSSIFASPNQNEDGEVISWTIGAKRQVGFLDTDPETARFMEQVHVQSASAKPNEDPTLPFDVTINTQQVLTEVEWAGIKIFADPNEKPLLVCDDPESAELDGELDAIRGIKNRLHFAFDHMPIRQETLKYPQEGLVQVGDRLINLKINKLRSNMFHDLRHQENIGESLFNREPVQTKPQIPTEFNKMHDMVVRLGLLAEQSGNSTQYTYRILTPDGEIETTNLQGAKTVLSTKEGASIMSVTMDVGDSVENIRTGTVEDSTTTSDTLDAEGQVIRISTRSSSEIRVTGPLASVHMSFLNENPSLTIARPGKPNVRSKMYDGNDGLLVPEEQLDANLDLTFAYATTKLPEIFPNKEPKDEKKRETREEVNFNPFTGDNADFQKLFHHLEVQTVADEGNMPVTIYRYLANGQILLANTPEQARALVAEYPTAKLTHAYFEIGEIGRNIYSTTGRLRTDTVSASKTIDQAGVTRLDNKRRESVTMVRDPDFYLCIDVSEESPKVVVKKKGDHAVIIRANDKITYRDNKAKIRELADDVAYHVDLNAEEFFNYYDLTDVPEDILATD